MPSFDDPRWASLAGGYGLLATIESERHAHDNPPIPVWLVEEYRAAWMIF